MPSTPPGAADGMRQRLQADLRSAIKARAVLEVAVLRGMIAAIDNAGAVPLSRGPSPRPHEVQRRRLGFSEVQASLWREYRARRAAVEEYARLGRGAQSEQASREMAVVRRYVSSPRKR